jgi:putative oxidoreductase
MSNGSNRSWGLTVLRVVVGIVFVMHGWQKLFGMKLPGVTGMMTAIGIPWPGFFAVVVTFVELLGGIALILGVATRVAAGLLAIDMMVAVLKVHLSHGFFLPMGFEFALSMLAANICLALAGGGAASLDGALGKKAETS